MYSDLPRPVHFVKGYYKIETMDKIAMKIVRAAGGRLQDRVDGKMGSKMPAIPFLVKGRAPRSGVPHASLWKMTEQEILKFNRELSNVPCDMLVIREFGSAVDTLLSSRADAERLHKVGRDRFLKEINDDRLLHLVSKRNWLYKQKEENRFGAKAIEDELRLIDERLGLFGWWYVKSGLDAPDVLREINESERSSVGKYQPPNNPNNAKIDQRALIERFIDECKNRGLSKGQTIPREILREIAVKAGVKEVPSLGQFKSGNRAYQEAREYASRCGYKRRRRAEMN